MPQFDQYDDTTEDLDSLLGELGLTVREERRIRRAARRGARFAAPGSTQVYDRPSRMVATPDLMGAGGLPWATIDLMGFMPPGWSADEWEIALRRALAAPAYRLTARATFATGAANESTTVSLASTNLTLLGQYVTYEKSSATAAIIAGPLAIAQKYPLSDDQPVRLGAMFGTADNWLPFVQLVGRENSLSIPLLCETAVGAPHYVDFVYVGLLIGGGVQAGQAPR